LKRAKAAATIAPTELTPTALAAPLNGATDVPEADAAALVPAAAADPDAAATLVGEAVGDAAAADDADARMEL